jgi:prefoldin subunit 5
VNVGSSVVVEKSIEDTKKLLEEQHIEISAYRVQLNDHLQNMMTRIQELQAALEQMVHGSNHVHSPDCGHHHEH